MDLRVGSNVVRVATVFEERYWYPDDGGQVWIAGYTPVDDEGRYLGRDAPELAARGLRVVGVAGAAQHHAEALASDAAAPGARLELRRDPGNPHDENAIAVLAGGRGPPSCCASCGPHRAIPARASPCSWHLIPSSSSTSE